MSDEIKNSENFESQSSLPPEKENTGIGDAQEKDLQEKPETESASANTADSPAAPSIFDKPVHSDKKPKKPLPKWLIALISVILCTVLVISAVYIPKKLQQSEGSSSGNTSSDEVTVTLCDYSAYNNTLDEVEALGKGGINNIVYSVDGFDFNLVQGEYEETSADSSGNQKTETKVGWTIDNYEGIQWSSSNISGLVQNALTVTAITKLEDNAADLSVYGLDSQSVYSRLSVNFKDGTGYTVETGNYSADKSGRYIRFSDSGTVYLSSYSYATYTSLSSKDMPALSNLGKYEKTGTDDKYYYDGKLMYFDAIFMFGTGVENPITFAVSDSETSYTSYKIMSPVEMAANDDKVYDDFLGVLSEGIPAQSVLEFMPDDSVISSYGMQLGGDKNHIKVMYIIAGIGHQLEIGNRLENGNYPVSVNSGRVIYEVSPESLGFIGGKYTDYLRTTLFLASINDMKSVSVKGEGLNTVFDITNICTDEENNVYEQTVRIGGKEINADIFKRFLSTFQRLQATARDEESFGKTDKAPSLTVTISYSDSERADSVITMYPYSERRYLYKLDGSGNSLISIADYNGVIEAAEKAANQNK